MTATAVCGRGIIPARAGFTRTAPGATAAAPDHPRSRGVYREPPRPSCPACGSSPLARGLRRECCEGGAGGWIIPARAGFTWRGPWPSPAAADHPRSRGVYSVKYLAMSVVRGSSPLARGLLAVHVHSFRPGGIIPARAGFTPGGELGQPRAQDHPRSRGVYTRGEMRRHRREGSSPLARGLRLRDQEGGDLPGIIPARAGFTAGGRRLRAHDPDHPRSRGVYASPCPSPPNANGSSPLARGLPLHRRPDPQGDRIIPARAGFTSPGGRGRGPHRDHPRSRGVYASQSVSPCGVTGSSPLARGLRFALASRRFRRGIIPARAGFTWTETSDPWPPRDHPRSRGVYARTPPLTRSPRGSSPLARGLPGRSAHEAHCLRIIPARAGFTRAERRTPARPHGSSPLARGLLAPGQDAARPLGIIPARAGFTTSPTSSARITKDHPRSRGVYRASTPPTCSSSGSSPLARGLQPDHLAERAGPRIIPARAGFTADRRARNRRRRDHPRSRGVYSRARARCADNCGSSPLARGLPHRPTPG